jgi:hypothetical protein
MKIARFFIVEGVYVGAKNQEHHTARLVHADSMTEAIAIWNEYYGDRTKRIYCVKTRVIGFMSKGDTYENDTTEDYFYFGGANLDHFKPDELAENFIDRNASGAPKN